MLVFFIFWVHFCTHIFQVFRQVRPSWHLTWTRRTSSRKSSAIARRSSRRPCSTTNSPRSSRLPAFTMCLLESWHSQTSNFHSRSSTSSPPTSNQFRSNAMTTTSCCRWSTASALWPSDTNQLQSTHASKWDASTCSVEWYAPTWWWEVFTGKRACLNAVLTSSSCVTIRFAIFNRQRWACTTRPCVVCAQLAAIFSRIFAAIASSCSACLIVFNLDTTSTSNIHLKEYKCLTWTRWAKRSVCECRRCTRSSG